MSMLKPESLALVNVRFGLHSIKIISIDKDLGLWRLVCTQLAVDEMAQPAKIQDLCGRRTAEAGGQRREQTETEV